MMKFNAEGLVSEVRPIIQRSIKELEQAKSLASQSQAPSGFPCQADLSAIPNEISAICDQIRSIDSWIGEKADALSGAESANKSVLEKVNDALSTPMPSGLLGKAWLFASDMGWLGEGSKKVANKIEDISKRTNATIANGVISFVKGVFDFGEAIIDSGAIIGTAMATPFTWIGDRAYDLYKLATGDTSNTQSLTGELWKDTMSFVSNDYVDSAYNKLYKDTNFGQTLDKYAYEPFKSDGTGSKIISGVGYVTGVAAATIATGGIAGATIGVSQAAVGAGVAATAAFGKYTGEKWGSQKAEYEYVKSIPNEQWSQLENAYKEGNISKADFERMQEIRNSDDWRTAENAAKGLVYGGANALWEGAQWYVGSKLAGGSLTGSTLKDASIRIGVDTGFNAADPVFRAVLDTTVSNKTINEAWNDQGGINAVVSNAGIGLVGSMAGEAFSGIKQVRQDIKNVKNMNDRVVIAKNKMNEYFNKNPILGIGEKEIEEAFNKINISKNDKEFAKVARQLGADPFCSAYYNTPEDKIMLRNNNTLQTIIHEVNHSLGGLFDRN